MHSNQVKTCSQCKQEKTYDKFYKHVAKKDGLRNPCKECTSKSDWYKRQCGNGANYHRINLGGTTYCPSNIKYYLDYQKTPAQKTKRRLREKRYREIHAHKMCCKRTVYVAIKDGILSKQPCSVCGTIVDIHAHHYDYSKPLEVVWLCRRHHQDLHNELRKQ